MKIQNVLGGNSHTVLGAISAVGAINVCLRQPGNSHKRRVVCARKRKVTDNFAANIPKGTTGGHFVQFVSDTLEIMDELSDMKGLK